MVFEVVWGQSRFNQALVCHLIEVLLCLFPQVKLNGTGSVVVWASNSTLACTVNDTTVRCWQPHTGETYLLSTQLPDTLPQTITCLAYSSTKGE